MDALSRFGVDISSSREALLRFLATDKAAIESSLIAAVTMPNRAPPPRLVFEAAIAIPVAGAGPDSPPGVPIDFRAEQEADQMCQFITMMKLGQFRNEAEQEAFLEAMPEKWAKALVYHMSSTDSRAFEEFEIRKGKLFMIDENQLKQPRLRLVVPMRLRVRVLTANHNAAAAGHRAHGSRR